MKKRLNYVIAGVSLTLLVLLGLKLYMKKNGATDMIARKWKLSKVDVGQNVPPESKALLEQFMMAAQSGAYFKVYKNNTYELSVLGMNMKGTWELNDEANEIMTYDNITRVSAKITIAKLNKDSLILMQDIQGQKAKISYVPSE